MIEKELAIEFAIHLTGHDKETIEQMFADWSKTKNIKSDAEYIEYLEKMGKYAI